MSIQALKVARRVGVDDDLPVGADELDSLQRTQDAVQQITRDILEADAEPLRVNQHGQIISGTLWIAFGREGKPKKPRCVCVNCGANHVRRRGKR